MLIDEIDEELTIASSYTQRETEHEMFKKRNEEGQYQILIKKYLQGDENKFREYFRVSRKIFYYVLSHIKDDIEKSAYNRVINPITAEEKLCLTVR